MRRHLPSALALAAMLLWSPSALGQQRFIQGATEETVVDVLRPWTQHSACECCVCWETAMTTVLSYWDDIVTEGGLGPWERMMTSEDRWDEEAFASLSNEIYEASGVGCGDGGWSFWIFDEVINGTSAVVNTSRGYDFEFDFDEWVWFATDIEDELNDERPIYYRFRDGSSPQPEGWQETEGHAIVVVGADLSTEVLYVYGNWNEIVSQKGFDDADDHGTVNVIPGGGDCDPATYEPEATTCGRGVCASTGTRECVDSFLVDSCRPGPADEDDSDCNGEDDDCDGRVDEDHVELPTSCGEGACAAEGVIDCRRGELVDTCRAGTPAADDRTCDGIDDDCDRFVDEDGDCWREDAGPDASPGPDGGVSPQPDGGTPPPPADDDGGDGCSCRAARPGAARAPAVLVVLLSFALALRRAR